MSSVSPPCSTQIKGSPISREFIRRATLPFPGNRAMLKAQILCNYTHVWYWDGNGAGLWLIEHRSQFPLPFSKLTQQRTLHSRITNPLQIKRLMKDWIHFTRCLLWCRWGALQYVGSPSHFHSLCKCNRRITQDKAPQSRGAMAPFWEGRGVQTCPMWCDHQNGLCYLSHWPVTWCSAGQTALARRDSSATKYLKSYRDGYDQQNF